MTYTVRFRPRASKQLCELSTNVRATIARVIDALAENRRTPVAVQFKGTDLTRVRVRDYRVVYEIRGDVLLVLVVRIGHGPDIYCGA